MILEVVGKMQRKVRMDRQSLKEVRNHAEKITIKLNISNACARRHQKELLFISKTSKCIKHNGMIWMLGTLELVISHKH